MDAGPGVASTLRAELPVRVGLRHKIAAIIVDDRRHLLPCLLNNESAFLDLGEAHVEQTMVGLRIESHLAARAINRRAGSFMKPGNLEGGFAWYRATHAARMALVRDGAPALPKIEVQSRFYWGRHDPVTLCAWMDRLPEYFADPEMEIAEDAGHFVHFETPEAANDRVIAFFSRTG